jgi:hypothetical protein
MNRIAAAFAALLSAGALSFPAPALAQADTGIRQHEAVPAKKVAPQLKRTRSWKGSRETNGTASESEKRREMNPPLPETDFTTVSPPSFTAPPR